MKLLAKYNRVNIIATIIVFLVGSICYYFILSFVLINQLDRDLKIEEQEIKDYVQLNGSLPKEINYKDQKVIFEPSGTTVINRNIGSVDFYNDAEKEHEYSRQLIFSINVSGKNYKVSISKSQQETEDLIKLIVLITLAIVVLLLLVLFIINRFVLNKLWHPFNNTLAELKQFNVSNTKPISLNDSNINEFKELNDAVTIMSNRVIKDYEALKNFTENASHEIQTPLAIVNSKLELLMQSENFTELQMQYIQNIQEETRRLSRLNQSLLLLTKIDNQQFPETGPVNIKRIISKHLSNYEELIAAKKITLTRNLSDDIIVPMNETMADILISNVITNAIKHNTEMGAINISLNGTELKISNTGAPLATDSLSMFERFKKDKPESDSLGLGLSIVKKICDRYNFKVDYEYSNQLHTITIKFS